MHQYNTLLGSDEGYENVLSCASCSSAVTVLEDGQQEIPSRLTIQLSGLQKKLTSKMGSHELMEHKRLLEILAEDFKQNVVLAITQYNEDAVETMQADMKSLKGRICNLETSIRKKEKLSLLARFITIAAKLDFGVNISECPDPECSTKFEFHANNRTTSYFALVTHIVEHHGQVILHNETITPDKEYLTKVNNFYNEINKVGRKAHKKFKTIVIPAPPMEVLFENTRSTWTGPQGSINFGDSVDGIVHVPARNYFEDITRSQSTPPPPPVEEPTETVMLQEAIASIGGIEAMMCVSQSEVQIEEELELMDLLPQTPPESPARDRPRTPGASLDLSFSWIPTPMSPLPTPMSPLPTTPSPMSPLPTTPSNHESSGSYSSQSSSHSNYSSQSSDSGSQASYASSIVAPCLYDPPTPPVSFFIEKPLKIHQEDDDDDEMPELTLDIDRKKPKMESKKKAAPKKKVAAKKPVVEKTAPKKRSAPTANNSSAVKKKRLNKSVDEEEEADTIWQTAVSYSAITARGNKGYTFSDSSLQGVSEMLKKKTIAAEKTLNVDVIMARAETTKNTTRMVKKSSKAAVINHKAYNTHTSMYQWCLEHESMKKSDRTKAIKADMPTKQHITQMNKVISLYDNLKNITPHQICNDKVRFSTKKVFGVFQSLCEYHLARAETITQEVLTKEELTKCRENLTQHWVYENQKEFVDRLSAYLLSLLLDDITRLEHILISQGGATLSTKQLVLLHNLDKVGIMGSESIKDEGEGIENHLYDLMDKLTSDVKISQIINHFTYLRCLKAGMRELGVFFAFMDEEDKYDDSLKRNMKRDAVLASLMIQSSDNPMMRCKLFRNLFNIAELFVYYDLKTLGAEAYKWDTFCSSTLNDVSLTRHVHGSARWGLVGCTMNDSIATVARNADAAKLSNAVWNNV